MTKEEQKTDINEFHKSGCEKYVTLRGIYPNNKRFTSKPCSCGLDDIIVSIREDILFDLDEIDNKPWRVFRQLATIMPEYADVYSRYEAFYSFGGSRKVMELIEEFEQTDDYKESYFSKSTKEDK